MTALEKYAKLEAIARYRDGPSDRMRDVVLSFGERTLMIVGIDDRPISHWPLINVHRLSQPGDETVLLSPFDGSAERIELTDRDMIEAIDIVVPHRAALKPVRRSGGRRFLAWLTILAFVTAGVVFWAVPVFTDQLDDLVPPDREAVIGAAVRSDVLAALDIGPLARDRLCTEPDGRAALDKLIVIAAGAEGASLPMVTVFDHPAPLALGLPGGEILLMRGMIEIAGTPEALAALLAHEIHHVRERAPLRKILRHASFGDQIVHILGDLLQESVPESAASVLMSTGYSRSDEDAADAYATAVLNAAGLPSTPYAALLLRLAETSAPGPVYGDVHPALKIRASHADAIDPIGSGSFTPALSDRDWLVLQSICEGI